jgi:hypothetical protein
MSIARPWQVLEPLLGQRELGNIWPEANKHLQNSAPWLKCSLKRKCIKLEIQPEAQIAAFYELKPVASTVSLLWFSI